VIAPTQAAPPYNGPPLLIATPDTVLVGATVDIFGEGFDAHQQGTLAIDGDTSGMPNYRVRGNGQFDETITIPADMSLGTHDVSAVSSGVIATVAITVVAPEPTPSPTPAVTASPTPSATPTSTPDPTPTPTASPSATPTPSPTPTATPTPTAPPPAGIDHVFVVVMENHAYSQVWSTADTPYTTSLVGAGALAADYHALTHPSLPNYLDLYGGSNYGITTDCDPSSSCSVDAVSLADNLESSGHTWKGYFESMDTPCKLSNGNGYTAHHDPFIYFDDIRTDTARCDAHVVNFSQLSIDLGTTATTPSYAMIVPNNCDNTHDCPVATGDAWLAAHVPTILASPACVLDSCLVAVTWDEDDGSSGNHVLTVFAGSAARSGVSSNVAYNHYSLLRTIEDAFGLPTQTANDANAQPMTDLLR
jgi:hypothetical protein